MLTEDQSKTEIKGLNASDAVVMLHLIARTLNTRTLRDSELSSVGTTRDKLTAALMDAVAVDFDEERATAMQQLQAASDAKQQQALQAKQ